MPLAELQSFPSRHVQAIPLGARHAEQHDGLGEIERLLKAHQVGVEHEEPFGRAPCTMV